MRIFVFWDMDNFSDETGISIVMANVSYKPSGRAARGGSLFFETILRGKKGANLLLNWLKALKWLKLL